MTKWGDKCDLWAKELLRIPKIDVRKIPKLNKGILLG